MSRQRPSPKHAKQKHSSSAYNKILAGHTPSITPQQEQPEILLGAIASSDEVQGLDLKLAYTMLVKACLRIQKEEKGG